MFTVANSVFIQQLNVHTVFVMIKKPAKSKNGAIPETASDDIYKWKLVY